MLAKFLSRILNRSGAVEETGARRFDIKPSVRHRSSFFTTRSLVFGFAGMILSGTGLLMLPAAARTGQATLPVDALFTATSAVCTTGLVVVDTGTHWSFFGQLVILLLVQAGSFGFMTGATVLLSILGRRIGLRERLLVGESLAIGQAGGMVRLVRQMAIFTLAVEGTGFLIFFIRLIGNFDASSAGWLALFQSVNAFTCGGFDLFGNFESIGAFRDEPVFILTTAMMIIIGGLSYVVVRDAVRSRRWDRLSLNSKIVFSSTALLLVAGTGIYFITEFTNPATLGSLSLPLKGLNAFFQAVTPRTAGFSTFNTGAMREASLFVTILLMFIGGAAGSTAGGIKINTFGLLAATVISTIRGKVHVGAFGREFRLEQIHRAFTVLVVFLGASVAAIFALTITERADFLSLVFETVSSICNVGLDTGVTPGLSIPGRLLVTLLMFVGRLGPLTLVMSLRQRQQAELIHYPEETISIG